MSSAGQGFTELSGGIADILASGDYAKEAGLFAQDVQYAKESTALQQYITNKQIFSGQGAERAGFAGSGLKTAGTALDVLRNTAQLGSLRKSQIAVQGAIEENNFAAQETAAQSQATTSMIGGIGGLFAANSSFGAAMRGG